MFKNIAASKSWVRAGTAPLAIGLMAGAVMSTSTEQLVADSFSTALSKPADAQSARVSGLKARPAVSGSEAYWLTRQSPSAEIKRAKWSAPVKLGDRLTFGIGDNQRSFEVVGVKPVDADATRLEIGDGDEQAVFVMCRETGRKTGQATNGPLVTFVLRAGAAVSIEPKGAAL